MTTDLARTTDMVAKFTDDGEHNADITADEIIFRIERDFGTMKKATPNQRLKIASQLAIEVAAAGETEIAPMILQTVNEMIPS